MAEQLAGTAVLRLKLSLSPQDRALLDGLGVRGASGVGSVGGGAPGAAPTRTHTVPGGRGGPSMLSGLAGLGAARGAAALAALTSPALAFGAPIVADAATGFYGRLRNAGRDVSESLGLGSYAREAGIAPRAADRTVAQLGIAAKYATEAQIKSLYGLNSQMATAEVEAENRVRETIGVERLAAFAQKLLDVLGQIATNTAPAKSPAATAVSPRIK